MTNQLVERGYLIQSLGNASHSGEHGFKTVPGLLKRVLEEQAWKERIVVATGEEFSGFSTLEECIQANPPKGLGASIELLRKIISDNVELLADFQAALRKPVGTNQYIEGFNNVKTLKPAMGNSKEYGLQKLADEGKIELLDQIKDGKISVNAAMKQAGYRRPRLSIYVDDPESAVKTLLTHASPEFINELRKLLNEV